MADYYTQTSFLLPLNEDQVKPAIEIIKRHENELAKNNDTLCFDYENEGNAIWFHGDYIEVDKLVDVVQSILDDLKIDDEIRFSWSYSCSKHHLNSFGGGACKLNAGDEPVVIDALDSL